MSAKQRIKNHLAYKLGQLLLDYDKAKKESLRGGGNTLTLQTPSN
ncbi:hypothetical protein ACI2E3_01635 [Campylobacter jejuni]